MKLPRLLSRQEGKPTPTASEHDLLPQSILFALRYNSARLGVEHIEPLLKGRQANLGFYLLMKATDDHDQLQIRLLENAARSRFDYTQLSSEVVRDAMMHLVSKPPITVQGAKLAQVSRAGFQAWNDRFDAVLGTANLDDGKSLFMVANSPYIGLGQLAAHSLLEGRSLGILKPSRFEQSELPVGFTMGTEAENWEVSPLDHDFVRPETAVIFDDTVHSGHERDRILRFWGEKAVVHQPDFLTAVAVPPSAF